MTAFDVIFRDRGARALLGPAGDPDDITAWKNDLGTFGEILSYRPLNGIPRPFKAMVDRGPPQSITEAQMLSSMVTIECYDDQICGIESNVLDTGGDAIDVALWPGQRPVTLSIKKRVSQSDNGLLKLECG